MRFDQAPPEGGRSGFGIELRSNDWNEAWRRDRTVFLVDSLNAIEQPLGAGEQPWLAATSHGPFVAWVTSRRGALQLLRPGADAAMTIAEHAADPVLAVAPGSKPPVTAVWEESDGDVRRIVCDVVTGD